MTQAQVVFALVLASGWLHALPAPCSDKWFGGCPDEQCFKEYRNLLKLKDSAQRGKKLQEWRTKCQKKRDEAVPLIASSAEASAPAPLDSKAGTRPSETRQSGSITTTPPEASGPSNGLSESSASSSGVVSNASPWVWGTPASVVGCLHNSGSQLRHFSCDADPPGYCPGDVSARCRLIAEASLKSLTDQPDNPRFIDVPLLPAQECVPFAYCGESKETDRALFSLQSDNNSITILRARRGQEAAISRVNINGDLLRLEHQISATPRPSKPSDWDIRAIVLRKILANDPTAQILQGADGVPLEKKVCALFYVGSRDDLFCFSRPRGFRVLGMNRFELGSEEQLLAEIRKSGPSLPLKLALQSDSPSVEIQLSRSKGLFGLVNRRATVWTDQEHALSYRTTRELESLSTDEAKPLSVSLMGRLIDNPESQVLATDRRAGACILAPSSEVECFLLGGTSWFPLASDFPLQEQYKAWYRDWSSKDFDESVATRFLDASIRQRLFVHRAYGDVDDSGLLLGISSEEVMKWTSSCETTLTLFGKLGAKRQATRFVLLDERGNCGESFARSEQKYNDIMSSFIVTDQPDEIESFYFGENRMVVTYLKGGESQIRFWMTPERGFPAVTISNLVACAHIELGPGKTKPNPDTIIRGLLAVNWRKEWKANPLGLVIRAQSGCR